MTQDILVTPRRKVARLLALVVLTSAALALGAAAASAATPSTVFDTFAVDSPDSQAFARFPERIADAGDLTGDGVRDIFAANYKLDVAGVTDAGKVTLFSGADRSIRYSITSPQLQAEAPNAVPPAAGGQDGPQFGFVISVPGDLNGDGKDDLVVGAPYMDIFTGTGTGCGNPEPNGCNENQGRAYAFNGATGSLLYILNNPQPQADEGVFATFGGRIGAAGDVTGDGRADVIVGSPANDVPAGCSQLATPPAGCRKNEGEAFIFNGATGALFRTLNIPTADRQEETCTTASVTARCGNFSNAQSPGDVDRDGVPDQLVAAYALRRPNAVSPLFFGRMYLFSGATGAVLSRIDQPVADNNAFWGLQDVALNTPGDVNGDGAADIYVTGFGQDAATGEASAGRSWVFDGAASVAAGTGVVLFEPKDPTPQASESFGFSAAKTDYNKDGKPDLYLGGLNGKNTETYVYDGKDGSLLKTLALPAAEIQPPVTGNNGSGLGYSSRAPGDLNGDGEPDFVASAPFQDVGGNQDQGKLYFFLSKLPPAPPPPGGGGTGSTSGGGMTSSGTSTADTSAPGVFGFGLTNNPFVVGGSTPIFGNAAAKKRHKKGTTFRYTLSEAATVRITIAQRLAGRRKGKRCVAPRRSLRGARKCTRVFNRGTLTRTSHVGRNSVAFSGRIGSKKLTPGSYLATLVATDAAKNSARGKAISFRIVKR